MAAKTVRDVMTLDPVTFPGEASLTDIAKTMRDSGIGAVIVAEKGKLLGLLTDRDVVVRALADGKDPRTTNAADICSRDVAVLSPRDGIEDAVTLMRKKAVRRLPVVENDNAVGIVSIGDLAMHVDRASALADISAAPANQ